MCEHSTMNRGGLISALETLGGDQELACADAIRDGVVCSSSVYCATYATQWWDYEERMWYLLNLFRVLNVDELIVELPTDASFGHPRFDVYEAATIEKLRAP
jgi:hypothetical protein